MSAKSLHSQSTPKSSSRLDEGVQAILELRAEKQKYKELQRLLRQGLNTLRNQQESVEQAEFKVREVLRKANSISLMIESMDFWMNYTAKQVMGGLKEFIYVPELERPKVAYVTQQELLAHSIRYHEQALRILRKAQETLVRNADKTDMSDFKIESTDRLTDSDSPC